MSPCILMTISKRLSFLLVDHTTIFGTRSWRSKRRLDLSFTLVIDKTSANWASSRANIWRCWIRRKNGGNVETQTGKPVTSPIRFWRPLFTLKLLGTLKWNVDDIRDDPIERIHLQEKSKLPLQFGVWLHLHHPCPKKTWRTSLLPNVRPSTKINPCDRPCRCKRN